MSYIVGKRQLGKNGPQGEKTTLLYFININDPMIVAPLGFGGMVGLISLLRTSAIINLDGTRA
jgi:hypothetical protein